MHKTILILAALIGALAAGLYAQSEDAGYHVTICHRTGSASNPYVMISPDAQGVVSGHLDHDQTGNGLGGDIIPVFVLHGVTYSKNLGINIGGVSGADILANGCNVPTRTPTPTPTPIPHVTPPPPTAVPEPMTLVLFGIGLAAVGFAAGRKMFSR
ncbi:MAG: PEP-CTERM sorting domain-containing protein [Pyrinomonadaceae bacterium]